MNTRNILASILVLALSAGIANVAFAQGKTRAEVGQELIDAQANGSNLVTDTSYPDVSPIYQQQAAATKVSHQDGYGTEPHGANMTGHKMMPASNDTCVGPMSFCSVYFGG
jgi:hypothetical protein